MYCGADLIFDYDNNHFIDNTNFSFESEETTKIWQQDWESLKQQC
jgi:hypothetical protein